MRLQDTFIYLPMVAGAMSIATTVLNVFAIRRTLVPDPMPDARILTSSRMPSAFFKLLRSKTSFR